MYDARVYGRLQTPNSRDSFTLVLDLSLPCFASIQLQARTGRQNSPREIVSYGALRLSHGQGYELIVHQCVLRMHFVPFLPGHTTAIPRIAILVGPLWNPLQDLRLKGDFQGYCLNCRWHIQASGMQIIPTETCHQRLIVVPRRAETQFVRPRAPLSRRTAPISSQTVPSWSSASDELPSREQAHLPGNAGIPAESTATGQRALTAACAYNLAIEGVAMQVEDELRKACCT